MKLITSSIVRRCAALAVSCGALGLANRTANAQFAMTVETQQPAAVTEYRAESMEDLQRLTANIALYPDAILAQMFVACTYPDDVVAAAQYLQNQGDPSQIDSQPWDASVKGLIQAPEALFLLASDTDSMLEMGNAYINQSDDLFAAIQSLRAAAANAGNLASNEQMTVVSGNGVIQIVPANPRVIFIPRYDSQVVYFTRVAEVRPAITFGVGLQVGLWLGNDFDWYDRRVYVGAWATERPWWRAQEMGVYMNTRPGVMINQTNVTNISVVNRTNISIRNSVTRERFERVVEQKTRPMPVNGPKIDTVRPKYTNVVNPKTNNTVHPMTPTVKPNFGPVHPTTPIAPQNVHPTHPQMTNVQPKFGPVHPTTPIAQQNVHPTHPTMPAVNQNRLAQPTVQPNTHQVRPTMPVQPKVANHQPAPMVPQHATPIVRPNVQPAMNPVRPVQPMVRPQVASYSPNQQQRNVYGQR